MNNLRPYGLKINLLSEPYSVPLENPVFSWSLSGSGPEARQTAFRAVISAGTDEKPVFDTGKIVSADSSAQQFSGLLLEENRLYSWKVKVWDASGKESAFSEPQVFSTEIGESWASSNAVWAPDARGARADFAFLRHEFSVVTKPEIEKALLSVAAASAEPAKQFVYNLYLNGVSVGLGPARAVTPGTMEYNSYDVTNLLEAGKNAVGALCYAPEGRQFLLQLTVFRKDGSHEILLNSGRDNEAWKALNGNAAFGFVPGKTANIGTGYYYQPAENLDAVFSPDGWTLPDFDDSRWQKAAPAGRFEPEALVPSRTENLRVFPRTAETRKIEHGYFIDLKQEISGALRVDLETENACRIIVRCGEELENGRVKYKMRTGNVYEETWRLRKGRQVLENFGMKNFRYAEILGDNFRLKRAQGLAVHLPFDESAAYFDSADPNLNRIYEFCKTTVKITSQSLYVDSQSRERGVYEGDALINMLSAYAVGGSPALARRTAEFLHFHRQWPAEYKLTSVLLAWLDYLFTTDKKSVENYYPLIKAEKLFDDCLDPALGLYRRPNPLDGSGKDCVLVDWPGAERDGYRMAEAEFNTAFNAFVYAAYDGISKIAAVLNKDDERAKYALKAQALKKAMTRRLYDPEKRAFRDGLTAAGEPIPHYAQHASAYPLALGAVEDPEIQQNIAAFLAESGMRSSVYGAFFVLWGLYNAGDGETARKLLTSRSLRSWLHQLDELSATLCCEAWDPSLKPNMTFSHAWGSAPAAALAFGLFGIAPLEPGFSRFKIRFCPGSLPWAKIRVPTVKGPISASFSSQKDEFRFFAEVFVPANTKAEIYLPAPASVADEILFDSISTPARREGDYLAVTAGPGRHELAIQ